MSEKTTGQHSLLNRFKSHCRDISEQVGGKYTPDEIAEIIKTLSVQDGYPCKVTKAIRFGEYKMAERIIPKSMAYASDKEINTAQNTLQAFADHNHFWLTEYEQDGKTYKSLYGLGKEASMVELMARGEHV